MYIFLWLICEIKNNDFVVINSIEEFLVEVIFEFEIFRKEGIKVLFIFLLKNKNKLIGFVGYESLLKFIIWE